MAMYSDVFPLKIVIVHVWWFEPLWKILVSWGYYSQYMEKKCSKPPTRRWNVRPLRDDMQGPEMFGLFEVFFVLNIIILEPCVVRYLKQVSPAGVEGSWTCKKGSARIVMAVARQNLELPRLFKLRTPLGQYPWISNVSATYKTNPQNRADSHCWFNIV